MSCQRDLGAPLDTWHESATIPVNSFRVRYPDEGLREQAESPPRPDLVIPPAPLGGGLVEWLLWAVGVVVAVVAWFQRRGVATTLRKAIEAAKGLIKEYDEAPYTAEIEAAKLHISEV